MRFIRGSRGDDTLTGSARSDWIDGRGGNDVIDAGAGNDRIRTGQGHDTIVAAAGHNAIWAGDGDNRITTGAGHDWIGAGDGDNDIDAGDGHNWVRVDDGDNRIRAGEGNDRIHADDGNNRIDAGDGHNHVHVDDGDNQITTGAGHDVIIADDGNNRIDAGDGCNRVHVDDGDNRITSGAGDDDIRADDGNNLIDAGGGDNEIRVGDGNNHIVTGDGNDRIHAGDGDQVIFAGAGRNHVHLDDGNSRIVTGDGNDDIRVDDGDNLIEAGGGNNRIHADDGNNRIITGGGRDHIHVDDGDNVILAGDGDNRITADDGDNVIITGDGRDVVRVDRGANEIATGGGDDRVRSGRGDDRIEAGSGDDRIASGGGRDTLTGGEGADRLSAGRGDDQLVYNLSDNLTSGLDRYDGGRGTDRLLLELTHGEALLADVQDDLANYRAHLEVGRSGRTFRFETFDLAVRRVEQVETVLINSGPTALDDAIGLTVDEDHALQIELSSLLANDSDLDRLDVLTLRAVGPAQQGQVELRDGMIIYDPAGAFDHLDPGDVAVDRFDYVITDLAGITARATVTVEITGVNDAPVALDDTASGSENATLTIDVLSNDSDIDGDDGPGSFALLSAAVRGEEGQGRVDIVDDRLVFSPDGDFDRLGVGEQATVTVDYVMADRWGATSSASVSVMLTGRNDAPVAVADSATTGENQNLTVDVLANDTDVDAPDTAGTFVLESAAIRGGDPGTVSIADNRLLFEPGAAFEALAQDAVREILVDYVMADAQGATSAATLTLRVVGENDAPTVAAPLAVATNEDVEAFPIDLLQGAGDVDAGALLSVGSVRESTGLGGWSLDAGHLLFDPRRFDDLNDGEVATLDFAYQVIDEFGAAVDQTLSVTVEGITDAPALSVRAEAGDSVRDIRLIVTTEPARDERVDLRFDGLPAGAVVRDANGQAVTDGVAGHEGTSTFTLWLPEGQSVDAELAVVAVGLRDTGEVIGESRDAVDFGVDVAWSHNDLTFEALGQSMWGPGDAPAVGWHEYFPLIGTADEAWSSGRFTVLDIGIDGDQLGAVGLAGLRDVRDLALQERQVAQDILAQAEADKAFAALKATHTELVANAWADFNAKEAVYVTAKAAYDAAKALADTAKVNMDADAANLAWHENQRELLWNQRVQLEIDARTVNVGGVQFHDPVKWALVVAKDAEIAAIDVALVAIRVDAEATRLTYEGLKATQDGLYPPMRDAKAARDAALEHAEALEDAANQDGVFFAHVPTALDVTAAHAELAALSAHVEASKVPVDAANVAVDLAQGALDLAQTAVDTIDVSADFRFEAELFARLGLQIDFDLDLGSVDAALDYRVTTESTYNRTTDMLTIAPMVTNLTTGDSAAFSTISPNATFKAALIYDLGADIDILIDGYGAVAGEVLFDLSPGQDGIRIEEQLGIDGEIVLVDFDSTDTGSQDVPFIETVTEDIVSISLALPTIETEGTAQAFDPGRFDEGDLLNVDFSEISGAFFNFISAGIDFSPEIKAAFSGLGDLSPGGVNFETVMAATGEVLGGIFDAVNGNADTDGDGVVPIFLLDATDETATSLLHLNLVPDDLTGIDANTGRFGFYAAYGESDPVVEVSIDIDEFVALVANVALGNGSGEVFNPLVKEFGLDLVLDLADVPETVGDQIKQYVDLSMAFEYADLDASTSVNFSQEFTLSVDDLLYSVTFETGDVAQFSATDADFLQIEDASRYDANGDGVIDYQLDILPAALFSNDTEIGMGIGYTLDLIKAEANAKLQIPLAEVLGIEGLPSVPIPVVDLAAGPLLRVQGELDLLKADLFESRFDLALGAEGFAGGMSAVDDVLTGSAGDDTLSGNEGNDILSGLEGDDLFVFADGHGRDAITDFQAGAGSDDVIDLRDVAAIADFQDLLVQAEETGNDTRITFGDGDQVVLLGVRESDLHEDDFLFT